MIIGTKLVNVRLVGLIEFNVSGTLG